MALRDGAGQKAHAADVRVGVTVLSGLLGSGKTTLLNRLVQDPRYARSLVIINEFGEVGVDHALVRGVQDDVVLLAGGCICCTVRGGLVDTLRDMFLRVVKREIKPFDHVLIETTGLADVAPVMFTLKHDFFVAERYVFRRCITVVDATHILSQLTRMGVAASQIALADDLVISKVENQDPAHLADVRDAIAAINPLAQITTMTGELEWVRDLVRKDVAPESGMRWPGMLLAGLAGGPHRGVTAFSVRHGGRWPRGRFTQVIDQCLQDHGDDILRIKGILSFLGGNDDAARFALHAVHRVRYPLVELLSPVGGEHRCELVFIVSGRRASALEQSIREALAALVL